MSQPHRCQGMCGGGRALTCGCFGVPQTDSVDFCQGLQEPEYPRAACARIAGGACSCNKQRQQQTTCNNQRQQQTRCCPQQTQCKRKEECIVCYIPQDGAGQNCCRCQPRRASCQQPQLQACPSQACVQPCQPKPRSNSCCSRKPLLECIKFPNGPGCVPMTCEALPNCPNKFICRPLEQNPCQQRERRQEPCQTQPQSFIFQSCPSNHKSGCKTGCKPAAAKPLKLMCKITPIPAPSPTAPAAEPKDLFGSARPAEEAKEDTWSEFRRNLN
nr:PREDICTED: keratin-associated protein 5-4-like [Bemisia tabaci]